MHEDQVEVHYIRGERPDQHSRPQSSLSKFLVTHVMVIFDC